MKISISIIDTDAGKGKCLARLIDRELGLCCASRHVSAKEALREIPRLQPKVVLMDISLQGCNALQCSLQLKQQLPGTQIIILSDHLRPESICEALAAGVNGFMLKQTPPAELFAAIRYVYAGGSSLSFCLANEIFRSFQALPAPSLVHKLSPREVEVLDLLAKGCRYKEIADVLKISYATAHTHIRHIYKKLDVHSNTEAVATHLQPDGPRCIGGFELFSQFMKSVNGGEPSQGSFHLRRQNRLRHRPNLLAGG
jgi:DNA-binding NarL/FixJ family response regulator